MQLPTTRKGDKKSDDEAEREIAVHGGGELWIFRSAARRKSVDAKVFSFQWKEAARFQEWNGMHWWRRLGRHGNRPTRPIRISRRSRLAGCGRPDFRRLQRGEYFLRPDQLRRAGRHRCGRRGRVRDFVAVAVVADTGGADLTLRACRQVLAEFGVPRVMLANRTERLEFRLEELLPRASAGILDRPE